MTTPYSEKWQASRDRLRQTLAPQTNRERHMVEWLVSNFTADEADEWTAMIERTEDVKTAVALAYDKGFAEGIEHAHGGAS